MVNEMLMLIGKEDIIVTFEVFQWNKDIDCFQNIL